MPTTYSDPVIGSTPPQGTTPAPPPSSSKTPTMGNMGMGTGTTTSPFGRTEYAGAGDINVDGHGVAIPRYENMGNMSIDEAMRYGHNLTPGISNERVFNYYVAPSMLNEQRNRSYEPLRQQMMNPLRNQAAGAANEFFRGYGGMQGGPQMQAYMQAQAPYMNAMSDTNAKIAQMQYANEDKSLAQLIALQQQNEASNVQQGQYKDQIKRQQEAEDQSFWGDVLGTVGAVAGTLIAPGVGTAAGAGAGKALGNLF